jgi:membrane protein implicated in regulation of membrane protease activity
MNELMYYVFLSTFLVGATLMLGVFVLSLLGIGKDHDADHDSDHDHDHGHDHDHHGHGSHGSGGGANWFLGWLTLRTLTAAGTFFGLAGLAALQGLDWTWSLAVACAAAVAAVVLVGSLMKAMHKLKADGTVRIERTVGQPATVYLSIPAAKSGAGKVTVIVQNRTMEYRAVTAGSELPTGAKVKVTAIVGSDTLEVAAA